MRRRTSPGSRPRARLRSAPDAHRPAQPPCMSTRPRIPSPIRPRRCSRSSRNVEDYPKFLPLCEELKVTRRERARGQGRAGRHHDGRLRHDPRELHHARASRPRAPAPSWSNISTGRSPSSKIAGAFSPTGANAMRGRVLYRLCLPLAPVRAAGGRALRASAVERYTSAFEARADAVYGPKIVALASQQ